MSDVPDQQLFKALLEGRILQTIDGQFRLNLKTEIDGSVKLYIQHESEVGSWYFVRGFAMAIICNNIWEIKEDDE